MSRTDSGGAKRWFPSAPPTKHETPSGVFCFERRTLSRLQKPSALKRSARVPNFSMQILRISMKSGDRRSLRSFSSEVFARRRPFVLLGVYLLDLVKAELPNVAQRIASLEWIRWIYFPSGYARNPGTASDCWHNAFVLTNFGWIIYLTIIAPFLFIFMWS